MSFINVEQNSLIRQAKLLQFANSNRIDGSFNDVTIQAGAESIPANRMVLACYSKFFESMFHSQLKERYQNTVEIKEFDGQAIESVIEYIYTGKININANNVMTLLGTADFLQIDEVTKMCFDYLEASLTIDNCMDIVKVSLIYSHPTFHVQIYQFISENFDEISKTINFEDLSKQDLMQLITNLNRNIVKETSLYTAIINWVKHDQNRGDEFASLFLLLDLQKFSSDFILNAIAEEPLVQASKDCLNATLFYFKSKNAQQQQNKASKILCVGGTEKETRLIEIYNSQGKSPSKHPDLPRPLATMQCLLKLDDFLYCISLITLWWPSCLIHRLNLKAANSQWEKIFVSTEERKRDFAAAVWNGKIVMTGGYNKTKTLNLSELFELRSKKWKNIAPMICARYNHALVVANSKLFAVGGMATSDNELASVELLNNETGKWKEVKPMNIPRTSFAAVTCNNFIYAIAGRSSNNAIKTVERYDRDKDKWSFVKSMKVGRMRHAACVLDGKIFVVGGKDQNEKAITTIDCYNPALDNWVVVDEIEQKFYRHAIVLAM